MTWWIIAGAVLVCIIPVAFLLRHKFKKSAFDETSAASQVNNSAEVESDIASVPFKDNKPPKDIYPLW